MARIDKITVAGPDQQKNYLINGNFDIWQRGTSFSAGNAYKADRWWIQNNAGTTQSQVASDLTGSTYIFRTTVTNATNSGYVSQSLENINITPLLGKVVTFSCYVRSSVSIPSMSILIRKSTSANTNFSSGTWNTVASTLFTSTTSWQRISVTAVVPADGTANGLLVSIEPPNNITNGATWGCC